MGQALRYHNKHNEFITKLLQLTINLREMSLYWREKELMKIENQPATREIFDNITHGYYYLGAIDMDRIEP
jgi:hypothetical protein